MFRLIIFLALIAVNVEADIICARHLRPLWVSFTNGMGVLSDSELRSIFPMITTSWAAPGVVNYAGPNADPNKSGDDVQIEPVETLKNGAIKLKSKPGAKISIEGTIGPMKKRREGRCGRGRFVLEGRHFNLECVND